MSEQTQQHTPVLSRPHSCGCGTQDIYRFENGYEASVVCTPYTYGGEEGKKELAVMHGGKIVYDTPITNDVLGWLSDDEVQEVLGRIAALPSRQATGAQA